MNWKVNYWTVLFALVVVGWQISCSMQQKGPLELSSDALARLVTAKIPNDIAKARIDSFTNYAEKFSYFADRKEVGPDLIPEATLLTNAIRRNKILNPDVRYFGIPRADIKAIAETSSQDMIYGYLSLKDTTIDNVRKSMVDLLFYVGLEGTAPPLANTGGGGTYYDFTDPCPTLCDQ